MIDVNIQYETVFIFAENMFLKPRGLPAEFGVNAFCKLLQMKAKSVDIRAVAEHAAVSIATVSRAINKPEQVRAELRSRIEASILELGYIPDAAARSLSSRKTLTIGAIIPTVDNAMFARGIDALQRYLTSQGYLLLLATHLEAGQRNAEELQDLQAQQGTDRNHHKRAERSSADGPQPLWPVKPLGVVDEKWHDGQWIHDGQQGHQRLEVHHASLPVVVAAGRRPNMP